MCVSARHKNVSQFTTDESQNLDKYPLLWIPSGLGRYVSDKQSTQVHWGCDVGLLVHGVKVSNSAKTTKRHIAETSLTSRALTLRLCPALSSVTWQTSLKQWWNSHLTMRCTSRHRLTWCSVKRTHHTVQIVNECSGVALTHTSPGWVTTLGLLGYFGQFFYTMSL